MPSRRNRPTAPRTETPRDSAPSVDAAERFAAALRETAAIDRERARSAAQAAARADELKEARRALDRAIEAVRTAKRQGTSTVAADQAWKAAKARVIELETGTAPSWAVVPVVPGDADVSDAAGDE